MDRESGNDMAREMEMKREAKRVEIQAVIDQIENIEAGYIREGESIKIVVLETPVVKTLKAEKTWPAGYWHRTAELEQATLTNPPAELIRASKTDLVYERLVAAGYRVSVDYDFEKSTSELDVIAYSIYEAE